MGGKAARGAGVRGEPGMAEFVAVRAIGRVAACAMGAMATAENHGPGDTAAIEKADDFVSKDGRQRLGAAAAESMEVAAAEVATEDFDEVLAGPRFGQRKGADIEWLAGGRKNCRREGAHRSQP